ncbi:MAG: hypothetical protein AAGH88_06485 [Planctomycetota bacterium]
MLILLVWPGQPHHGQEAARDAEPAPQPRVTLSQPMVWHYWQNEQPKEPRASAGGPLALETVRQAVLIAARDELGARTLDPALGEPASFEDVIALEIKMKLFFGEGTDLELRHDHERLLDTVIPTDWRAYRDLIQAIEVHEAASRGDYVRVWRDAGVEGDGHGWRPQAGVPDDIRSNLAVQSLVTQFAAVRALHALIEADGESPERLWALCRAYTNLGQECRWYIQTQYATFHARALLYAQRLAVKVPDHPLTDLAKAYTFILCGYPKYAERHLAALDKRVAEADQAGQDAPSWASLAGLLRACYAYDMPSIREAMKGEGAESHLAALWNVKSIEFIDLAGLAFSTIEASMDVNPLSLRNAYPAYEVMGVSAGHRYTEALPRLFGAVTATQYQQLADVPPAIQQNAGELGEEPLSLHQSAALGWVMIEQTAAGHDDAELSYAVLGTLIGEANALHVLYRARFMRAMWGVDTTDYLRDAIHAIERHPFAPLIYTYVFRSNTINQGMAQLMGMFEPTYINLYHLWAFTYHIPYRRDMVLANGKEMRWYGDKAGEMELQESGSWLVGLRWFYNEDIAKRGDWARRMNGYDPHNPLRAAMFLRYLDLPPNRFNRLSERYGHHPVVAHELADKAEELGDVPTALKHAAVAAEAAPERRTLERIARLHLQLGDEDAWLAAMKQALAQPDMGLDRAQLNRLIANTYMNQGRYDEALAYTQAAAGSWAYWAMETHVICLAVNGRHEEAERLTLAMDERYGGPTKSAWLNYMSWAGQANGDDAIDLADRIAGPQNDWDPHLVLAAKCWARIAAGRYVECLELIDQHKAQGDLRIWHHLRGLIIARQLQDADRVRVYSQSAQQAILNDQSNKPMLVYAPVLIQAIEDNKLDEATIRAWQAQNPEHPWDETAFYAGWTAYALGDRDLAKRLLLETARHADFRSVHVYCARTLLRGLGVSDQEMAPLGFTPAHVLGDPVDEQR